jgi:predicted dehydrogenase
MAAVAEPIRFGLVGAGAIARAYVEAIAAIPEARLVAIADLRSEAATMLAASAAATPFTSVDDLANHGGCEAVIVCTPPHSHAEVTLALLGRGIAVLCEKPISISQNAARQMIDTAARTGVVLAMASKFRYVQAVAAARELVASGTLGELMQVENAFSGRIDMSRRWNSDPWVSGGGVIIDNGTHSADIIRFLAGPVRSVLAVEGRRLQSAKVEDSAHLVMRCAGGALATADLSWSMDRMLNWFVRLHGSEAVIEVGWRESRLRRHGATWTSFAAGYDKQAAFRCQLLEFCRSLRGEPHLLVSGEEALHSVAVVQAAYRSIAEGSWIEIGPVEPIGTGAMPRARAAE